jgi:hypothetical protein
MWIDQLRPVQPNRAGGIRRRGHLVKDPDPDHFVVRPLTAARSNQTGHLLPPVDIW